MTDDGRRGSIAPRDVDVLPQVSSDRRLYVWSSSRQRCRLERWVGAASLGFWSPASDKMCSSRFLDVQHTRATVNIWIVGPL